MRGMDHFRIDTVRYERHIAEARTNADRVGQLLETIGSLAPVTRTLRRAVEDGRMTDERHDTLETLVKVIAETRAPDTIHRPEPAVDVDQGLLDDVVELLLKTVQLMRFSNFVVPPGGSPDATP